MQLLQVLLSLLHWETHHKRGQCLRHVLSLPAGLHGDLLYDILDNALSLFASHLASVAMVMARGDSSHSPRLPPQFTRMGAATRLGPASLVNCYMPAGVCQSVFTDTSIRPKGIAKCTPAASCVHVCTRFACGMYQSISIPARPEQVTTSWSHLFVHHSHTVCVCVFGACSR